MAIWELVHICCCGTSHGITSLDCISHGWLYGSTVCWVLALSLDHRKHGCNLEIATLKALCAVDPKQMQIEWQHGIVFLQSLLGL